jgi:hypothetical protein
VHPKILTSDSGALKLIGGRMFGKYLGYIDSLITLRLMSRKVEKVLRSAYLWITVKVYRPDIIHAIEIQHAGYLVSKLGQLSQRQIVTNWGSDIFYFQHFVDHKTHIERTLKWATHYSAECSRDYVLARNLGYRGIELPKIPNAGGFENYSGQIKCSNRKLIVVKTYGGQFGAGSIAIQALRRFLDNYNEFEVFFYSVTPDLIELVEELSTNYQHRVTYSSVREPISHDELMELFLSARVYLGCSISDGLSTSFLQAICTGAYPIQTNTSCADELIDAGAQGSIIAPNVDEIYDELVRVSFNSATLDNTQTRNAEFAAKYLGKKNIADIAKSYYFD